MRTNSSLGYYQKILNKLSDNHDKHIAVYGKNNDQRLTGKHETASISQFTYGEGDRGASIRIPVETIDAGYKSGYLEDRRPASNADPYEITKVIIDTIT
jgi:glutamine synthetase